MTASELSEPDIDSQLPSPLVSDWSRRIGGRHVSARRAGWLTLWLPGLAAGVSVLVLTPANQLLANRHADQFFVASVGWSFIASGLIVWRRRPGGPLGAGAVSS